MDLPKPLLALRAIVNPIGVIPFIIHFTQGFSRLQRQRTIRIAAFSAFVVIAIPLLTGPATISTMVIYADKTRYSWQLLAALAVEVMSDGLVTLFPVLASKAR